MKSRDRVVRTAKALKLWEHPEFDPRKVELSWRSRLANSLGMGGEDTAREWTEDTLAASAARKLQAELSITPIRLSQLIKVEYESADRDLAAKVANTVAAQYIDNERDERFRMTTEVSQQLQQRLSALREKLATSERALQAYRESKGLVNVGGSAQANSSQQMGAVTERMLQARARRMELESAYAQLRNLTPSSYGSVPEVVRDSGVTDAQRLVSANAAKVAEMAERLGPEHEQLKQARAELAQAQEALQTRQAAIVRSVTREYEAARGTELALERNLNELRGSAQGVNRDEFQLAVL
ncbi:MAG: GumC family protein, partial [Burkholderiaceae bacterium]